MYSFVVIIELLMYLPMTLLGKTIKMRLIQRMRALDWRRRRWPWRETHKLEDRKQVERRGDILSTVNILPALLPSPWWLEI